MKDDPKIVSQKTVFKAKLFDVKELKIKRAGKSVIHRTAERHPTVSVLPLTEDYEIYLVGQYRYMLGERTLEAMAGFINRGEAPLSAAKRELQEETGLTAIYWKELVKIQLAASVFKAESTLFLAKDLKQGRQKQDEGEDISVVKMKLSDAVNKVMKKKINHAATVIGILFLDKLRREGKL